MRVFLLLVVFAALSSTGSAYRSSNRLKNVFVAKKSSAGSSCYYNLFLRNAENTGFGGATVSVLTDDSAVLLQSLTLPTLLRETGWQIPVVSGAKLTIVYDIGSSSRTTNEFWVTDANGNTVLAQTAPVSGSYKLDAEVTCTCFYLSAGECPSPRMRNEYRSLTYCDKTNYLNALQEIRFLNHSGVMLYDSYILHHNIFSTALIEKSQFLPWHRMFILWFENDLRALGGPFSCLTLPYWDWTLDFGNESTAFPYEELGGMSEQSCIGGRFANWTDPSMMHDDMSPYCVYRRYTLGDAASYPFFPSISAIELAITANRSYAAIFRALVRNPHKSVHNFIGGPQGSMSKLSSPADPFFWIHHTMLDRVWAMWQDCYDYERDPTLEHQWADLTATHDAGLNDAIVPTYPGPGKDVVAWQTLDIHALQYRYPPTFETLVKLNAGNPVYEANTCQWDWFSPEQQANQGLSYRVQVHNDWQRLRIMTVRETYTAAVAATSEPDYYQAKLAQLTAECDMSDAVDSPDFPDMFNAIADTNLKIGPSLYFKNACKLLATGQLALSFSH